MKRCFKNKRFVWLKGVIFGAVSAGLIWLFFGKKTGKQVKKELTGFFKKTSREGKEMIKKSEDHTKLFSQQVKNLVKSIGKEVKNFKKSTLDSYKKRK